MTGRIAARLSPILLALALSGCGGPSGVTGPETAPETQSTPLPTSTAPQPRETTKLVVYFLRDGKVAAAGREVPRTQAVAAAAVRELANGPTAEEEGFGLSTEVPLSVAPGLTLSNGLLEAVGAEGLARPALAQLVYTLTQFPSVDAVELGGRRYTRADFEDVTPAILVESPLPDERLSSPLHARGTANTFEATFDYELVDADGEVVAHNFVTATSGSGQRGTFDFTAPFSIDRSGPGTLRVFEISAEDGSRIHGVDIPLRLER